VIWNGGGVTMDLSDSNNWVGGVAPVTGDSVVFAGTSAASITNGLPSTFVFGGITFDPSALYSFAASSVILGGNITDNSRNHIEAFTFQTTFNATHTVSVAYDATFNLA